MAQKTTTERLVEIRQKLEAAKPRIGKLIPENSSITADEVIGGAGKQIAESTQDADPKRQLHTCSISSLVLAISEAASLGLVPGIGEDGWLIGYDNNKAAKGQKARLVREAQWMTGIKGLVRLIHMQPNVERLECDVVKSRDEFSWEAGTQPRCHHLHARGDRGETECAYLIVWFKGGSHMGEKMDMEDLKQARGVSKMGQFGAWVKWTDQMYRKCVVHRAAKWLPLSPKIKAALDRDAMILAAKEVEQREEIGAELAEAARAAPGEGAAFEELLAEEPEPEREAKRGKAESPAAKAEPETVETETQPAEESKQ